MREQLRDTGVQVATINPGPCRTGLNDPMYDTLDKWYDPAANFTPAAPIRDIQQLFAGNDLQLGPQGMIDFMIEVIPQDKHRFRNVYPERFIDDVKADQRVDLAAAELGGRRLENGENAMANGSAQLDIDILSDVVCPWCVIGWKQLERALEETGVEASIRWHPFELNPDMPAEGENLRAHLAAKYGTTSEGSRAARARLTAMGAELGFRFDYFDDMRMVNTFAAHRLLAWAETHGAKHALKLALFAAYFSERRDVSDPEVLADAAAGVGLDRDAAAAVLADGSYGGEVRAVERMWLQRGVQGVPAVIFQRRHLVSGAQGAANYTAILRQLTGQDAA